MHGTWMPVVGARGWYSLEPRRRRRGPTLERNVILRLRLIAMPDPFAGTRARIGLAAKHDQLCRLDFGRVREDILRDIIPVNYATALSRAQ